MKLNVLIVDDDQKMRVTLRSILTQIFLDIENIYEADNGRQGLEILTYNDINLLITDLNMPELDGLQMLKYLRKDPDLRNIPTVVISSGEDPKKVDAVKSLGIVYIQKPFTRQLLESQIIKLGKSFHEYSVQR